MNAAYDHFMEHQPACDQISTLLAFEKKYRGELVGLMSLRKIFQHAGRFGLPGKKLKEGKREALLRLPVYRKLSELSSS